MLMCVGDVAGAGGRGAGSGQVPVGARPRLPSAVRRRARRRLPPRRPPRRRRRARRGGARGESAPATATRRGAPAAPAPPPPTLRRNHRPHPLGAGAAPRSGEPTPSTHSAPGSQSAHRQAEQYPFNLT